MATYMHPVLAREMDYIPYCELSSDERALVDSPDHMTRVAAAENRLGLDVLKDDMSWLVREQVASSGFALHDLVFDRNPDVRYAVAYQGFGLDLLADDVDSEVRALARTLLIEHFRLDPVSAYRAAWADRYPELCAGRSGGGPRKPQRGLSV